MSKKFYRSVVVTLLLLSSSYFVKAANISAIANGNWSNKLSWSTSKVPTAADVVTIAGYTVTVNVTTAVASSLTIASSGILDISNGDKLTLGGVLSNAGTIAAGTGSLLIGGSLTNSGTLNLSKGGTLTFDGAANSTISSSGGTYDIAGTVVLDMGSSAISLDVQDANFITGINTGGNYYFTFTRGTWKMDNSGTLNNIYNVYTTTPVLTIPYGAVLESDAGTMNLATAGKTGNVLLSGELFINGGTVNVQTGQTTTQDFQYYKNGGTPQLYISSGSLNIGSGFNPTSGTDYIDFHMTGGTMLITSKQASSNPTFQLQNVTGGKTFMSGGQIILEQPGTGDNADLDMGGPKISPYSVTGGTVQFGTSTMPMSTLDFWIQPYSTTNYPNLDVETNKNPGVLAETGGNVNALSVYIGPAGTFDASNIGTLTITSSNGIYAFDDEGSFIPGGNTVSFSGGVSQLITSTALSNVGFSNVTVANTSGNVVLGVATTIATKLNFTSGDLDASAYPLTISNGSNAITGTGNSSYIITGDGVTKTGYLLIQKLPTSKVLFPIGNANYYLPVSIQSVNSNTAYSAYVYPGVTTNGESNGTSESAAVLSTMADATWNITQTAGTGSATLNLNWASSGTTMEGSLFQTYTTNIGITQFKGGSWQPTAGSGNVATETANTSFSTFTQFSVIGTPISLPITLGNFNVQPKGRTSYLSWAAFPDGQAASFTVERSSDGVSWTPIGMVRADATATVETDYSFTDAAPVVGQDDYRLYIQNADGSTSYSSIQAVEFASLMQVSLYPNPANGAINIALASSGSASAGGIGGSGGSAGSAAAAGKVVFRLVNTAGQVLQSRGIEAGGPSSLTMNTGGYPAGVYYIEVLEGGQLSQTTAVMIVH